LSARYRNGARANYKPEGDWGSSVSHMACSCSSAAVNNPDLQAKIVQTLLQAGADPNQEDESLVFDDEEEGDTPLLAVISKT